MPRIAPLVLLALLAASPAALPGSGAPPATNETYQPTNLEYLGRALDGTDGVDLLLGGPTSPYAEIVRSPAGTVQPGEVVTFDASGSHARRGRLFGGTSMLNWVWDLGDGAQANAPVVRHAYARPGVYHVNLVVHDDTGWRSSRAHTIAVGDAPCGRGGQELWIPTGEGLRMHGWLGVPAGPGPFPTILQYGPYAPGRIGDCDGWVRNGYAHAWVAAPGREFSTGHWDMFGAQTQRGGYDAVEWLAAQPWSNGKVGMEGVSGPACAALLTAGARPPHLTAVVAKTAYSDMYRDIVASGGIPNSDTFVNVWLPLLTVQDEGSYGGLGPDLEVAQHGVDNALVQATLALHPTYDAFWEERTITRYPSPAAAVLVYGNQRDLWPRAMVELQPWVAPAGGRVIAVPGGHTEGDLSGWEAANPATADMLSGEARSWFARFLRGEANGVEQRPPVLTFTSYGGDVAATFDFGRWEQLGGFPAPETEPFQFHLRSMGDDLTRPSFHGLTAEPAGDLELPGVLPYSPVTGATSDDTAALVHEVRGLQEPWELTSLAYQTPVLDRELRVNGPATLSFDAALLASDVGFMVQVSDVWPDGSSHYVSKGELLASHRALDAARSWSLRGMLLRPWHPHTAAAAELLLPGVTYRFDVEVWGIHNVFLPGHRLRLDVAAQDLGWRTNAEPGVAALVFHDAQHPSTLNLAVLPKERSRNPFPLANP